MALHRPYPPNLTPWSEPESPTAREKLRAEKIRHEAFSPSLHSSLDEFKSLRASTLVPSKLDRTQIHTSGRLQDFAEVTGTRKALPTNVSDVAACYINVNMYRSRKTAAFADNPGDNSGRIFNGSVLTDVWQEKQQEPLFSSGFIPKEIRRQPVTESEYSDRFRPKEPSNYTARLRQSYGIAVDKKNRPKPLDISPEGDCVQYARNGFGVEDKKDHTIEAHKGAAWVGNAPVNMYVSLKQTADVQEKAEFQKKDVVVEPKERVLRQKRSEEDTQLLLDNIRSRYTNSDRFTSKWQSMYGSDFVSYAGHRAAPQMGTEKLMMGSLNGVGYTGRFSSIPTSRPNTCPTWGVHPKSPDWLTI